MAYLGRTRRTNLQAGQGTPPRHVEPPGTEDRKYQREEWSKACSHWANGLC